MSTPFESAQLNLKIFELRREPLLRQAREWFLRDFNPESFEEMLATVRGEHNAWFRMVVGYWSMAASMVTTGAIDREAFCAAQSEIFATFCKIQPFLAEMRQAVGEPRFCSYIEDVVMAAPDAEATMKRLRERFRAMAKARRDEKAK